MGEEENPREETNSSNHHYLEFVKHDLIPGLIFRKKQTKHAYVYKFRRNVALHYSSLLQRLKQPHSTCSGTSRALVEACHVVLSVTVLGCVML